MGGYKRPLKKISKKRLKKPVVPPGMNMSVRQLQYADLRAQGLSPREAGTLSGYCDNSGNWSRLENCKNIQEYMRGLADQAGLTPGYIIQRLVEGMEATATREFCTKGGELVTGAEMEDLPTRLEYIKTSSNLLGLMGKNTDELPQQTTNILVLAQSYKSLTVEELAESMQKIRLGIYEEAKPEPPSIPVGALVHHGQAARPEPLDIDF